jgi:CMP-N-acetylneuraminic acid synthetase
MPISNNRTPLPTIVALVPMRHSSERVEGKNYRNFCGNPLFCRILTSLSSCSLVSRIVIDTDSPTIREYTAREFPRVIIIDRPDHLRSGDVPMNDVLLHDVKLINADFYLQTHCTNPLLRSETISKAIELFLQKRGTYDSLFSVTPVQVRLWDKLCRPLNHNPSVLLRTQDLPPVFAENSCLYIFSRQSLKESGSRIGRRPLMFKIERCEAWDIDDEIDFRIAEFLFKTFFTDTWEVSG